MNHVWISLILFSFLHLVHGDKEECVSSRKWQVGNTIYENILHSGELYLYARCSIKGFQPIGQSWNLCTNGQLKNKLPECPGGDIYYWCGDGNRWYINNTEYEVVRQKDGLFVIARCNQQGFSIEGDVSVLCMNTITQDSLPYCRNSTDQSRVCKYGKKWSEENTSTSYEIFRNDEGLIISARCNQAGFHMGDTKWVSCEHGIIPTRLPQCRYGREYCSDLPVPQNGYKFCSANSPAKYSSCTFYCKNTYYLRGSRRRNCTENLQWSGKEVQCFNRPECPTPLPLLNGTVENCSPGVKILYGHVCNFRCNAGHKLLGSSKLSCRINGKLQDDKGSVNLPKCVDMTDPCANRNCSHYCRTNHGAVQCYCHNGFRLDEDGKTCTDINECEEGTHNCDHKCINGKGSYRCQCHVGYKLASRYKCEEVISILVTAKPERKVEFHTTKANRVSGGFRETQSSYPNTCSYNNGGCNHYCRDDNGTINCSCSKGYELQRDNKTCEDVNECLFKNFGCSHTCSNTAGNAHCSCPKGFTLENDRKNCIDIDECAYRTLNNCDQKCHNNNGSYTCSCHPGYVLINEYKCNDVNECLLQNFGCSDGCTNTRGGAYCSCPRGFKLKSDGKHCTDVDECAHEGSNNCSQICYNTNGGYKCSCHPGQVLINDLKCEGCRINSYRSSSDTACVDCPSNSHTNSEGKTSVKDCLCNTGFYGNISNDESCRDINECDSNNFGCSDNCVNTLGNAFCSCPQGFQLQEDQKTCSDIEECSVKNGGCQGLCHNSIGSFHCTCQDGYTVSEADNYACDDVDECKENNGGCSGECINFLGGYQCSCAGDFHLGVDGKTCQTLYCSEVPVPYHSRLVCFPETNKTAKSVYSIEKSSHSAKLPVGTLCKIKCDKGYTIEESSNAISCQKNGIWNTTVHECKVSQCPPLKAPENGDVHPPECKEGSRTVREKCYFTCNAGYRMKENKTVFVCQNKLQWNHNDIPNCEPELITPYVSCPSDVTVDLLPGQNSSDVILKYPESNMEDIQVVPNWVDFGRLISFPAGKTDITVTARNLNFNNLTTSCTLSVIVIDTEFPEMIDCPEAIDISGSNVDGAVVYWEEPLAVDNVGIKSLIKNAEPNATWFPGIHTVEYIAEDFAGNIARCSFEINITSPECSDLADPENGEANCMDWVYGKLCEPSCNLNYTRGDSDDQYYVCDDNGTWSPSNVIPPCLRKH